MDGDEIDNSGGFASARADLSDGVCIDAEVLRETIPPLGNQFCTVDYHCGGDFTICDESAGHHCFSSARRCYQHAGALAFERVDSLLLHRSQFALERHVDGFPRLPRPDDTDLVPGEGEDPEGVVDKPAWEQQALLGLGEADDDARHAEGRKSLRLSTIKLRVWDYRPVFNLRDDGRGQPFGGDGQFVGDGEFDGFAVGFNLFEFGAGGAFDVFGFGAKFFLRGGKDLVDFFGG